METLVLNSKKMKRLQKPDIENGVEAEIFSIEQKRGFKKGKKIVKKLYIDDGEIFTNKLYTISKLIDYRSKLADLDIVLPEQFALFNNNLCAYTQPFIEGITLDQLLKDRNIPNDKKLEYLAKIGVLLEKMEYKRKYEGIENFHLNDLHEKNFVIEKSSGRLLAVDIDSCRIADSKPFASKYLALDDTIPYLSQKYEPYFTEDCNFYLLYKADQNTDLFCYYQVLLNYFYNGNIYKLSLPEFYDYLQYLEDIGFPKELVTIFSKMYSLEDNKNPYEYLEGIPSDYLRADRRVFEHIRKK